MMSSTSSLSLSKMLLLGFALLAFAHNAAKATPAPVAAPTRGPTSAPTADPASPTSPPTAAPTGSPTALPDLSTNGPTGNPQCIICPFDEVVTLPDAIVPEGTGGFISSNLTCAETEALGLAGNFSVGECVKLREAGVPDLCGCEATGPVPTDSPVPVETPAPTTAPIDAPSTSPTTSPTTPPTTAPTGSPTTAPAQPTLFDTVVGIVLWPFLATWNLIIFIFDSITGLFG